MALLVANAPHLASDHLASILSAYRMTSWSSRPASPPPAPGTYQLRLSKQPGLVQVVATPSMVAATVEARQPAASARVVVHPEVCSATKQARVVRMCKLRGKRAARHAAGGAGGAATTAASPSGKRRADEGGGPTCPPSKRGRVEVVGFPAPMYTEDDMEIFACLFGGAGEEEQLDILI